MTDEIEETPEPEIVKAEIRPENVVSCLYYGQVDLDELRRAHVLSMFADPEYATDLTLQHIHNVTEWLKTGKIKKATVTSIRNGVGKQDDSGSSTN